MAEVNLSALSNTYREAQLHGKAAYGCFLVLGHHVAAGGGHGLDGVVKRDDVGAVAPFC